VVLLLGRGAAVVMPTFVDRHPVTLVPSALRQRLYLEARQHVLDPHGVQPVGCWIEDGAIYCIVVASTDQAVCQHHADRGLACDELHELRQLDGRAPTDDEDLAKVRAVIRQLWWSDQSSG
jgi:hypothetical protein